jgi:signal peptidase II
MRARILAYSSLTIVIAALDIIAKLIIQKNFVLGETREILGDFFRLTYILNSGGVFGSKLGSNHFYLISAILVVALVIFFLFREFDKNRYVDISLFIVLGGALGNLFDRIRMGAVVDFLDFNFFKINVLGYHFDRWPTFNLADVAVTLGMILLIIIVLFRLGREEQSEENHA